MFLCVLPVVPQESGLIVPLIQSVANSTGKKHTSCKLRVSDVRILYLILHVE